MSTHANIVKRTRDAAGAVVEVPVAVITGLPEGRVISVKRHRSHGKTKPQPVAKAPAAKPDVVIIDTPDEVLCGLDASARMCVSTTCAAALTPRLGKNNDHPTRCAFDSGALEDDERDRLTSRRRGDCMRLTACEEAWIVAHASYNINAPGRCPAVCEGFVQAGGLVPLSALTRVRKAAGL